MFFAFFLKRNLWFNENYVLVKLWKNLKVFGCFGLFVCGDRMLFVMFTSGSRFKALKMDEDSRCVLDIEALEVAMGFLFFCVKKISCKVRLVQFFQVNTHIKRKTSPNLSWLQLADFFFRKVDILWINRGFPGSPPWLVPLMDREPTMDVMLLCLGGANFLNQKLPPVSWAQGLKSVKLLANHCCVFLFFCVCFKNGSAFDVFHDSILGPNFFFHLGFLGFNRGLIFQAQLRPSIQEALKTSFAEFRNQLVPELCLAVRGAVVQAHSEVPLSRRASRETAVDTVEKSQTSGELRGGDFSHSTACLWQWGPVGVGTPCDWCGGIESPRPFWWWFSFFSRWDKLVPRRVPPWNLIYIHITYPKSNHVWSRRYV